MECWKIGKLSGAKSRNFGVGQKANYFFHFSILLCLAGRQAFFQIKESIFFIGYQLNRGFYISN